MANYPGTETERRFEETKLQSLIGAIFAACGMAASDADLLAELEATGEAKLMRVLLLDPAERGRVSAALSAAGATLSEEVLPFDDRDAVRAAVAGWATQGGLEFNIIDPAQRSNSTTTVLSGGIDVERLRRICNQQAGLTMVIGS